MHIEGCDGGADPTLSPGLTPMPVSNRDEAAAGAVIILGVGVCPVLRGRAHLACLRAGLGFWDFRCGLDPGAPSGSCSDRTRGQTLD